MKQWIKLADTKQFTVVKLVKKQYQRWNNDTKQYERSEEPQKGFSPTYMFEMEEGMMSLSQSQVGQMLVGVMRDGIADINKRTFEVQTNHKTGIEIRYFINPTMAKEAPVTAFPREIATQQPEVPLPDANSIPF